MNTYYHCNNSLMIKLLLLHLGITCGDPGVPLNGSVSSNGSFVTSVATFACDFGFELEGDTQRVCEENGMWTNMVPNCTRKSLA